MSLEVAPEEQCPARYVGPTGIVWVCVAAVHPVRDPQAGYAGTDHTMRAVQTCR